MNIEKPIHFLHFLARRFGEERCLQVAGSLTFTTLLSLVPMVTIALTMISAFPMFSGMASHIRSFVFSNLVPESSSRILSLYVTQFSANAERLTALGIAFLVVTALTLMLTIDHILNTIWRISKHRSMLHRILIYWGMLTIGPILIGGSLSITSWLLGRSAALIQPGLGILLLKTVPTLLTVAALSLLYLIVPNTSVPRRDAILGGAIAGTLFELMKSSFGWYITHFTAYKLVYGAFASIPVFLLWIYLSWIVVLSGAVFTASLPTWDIGMPRDFPGKRFHDALLVLAALCRAQRKGDAPTAEQIGREQKLDRASVESLLELFSRENLARETVEGGWMLARNADEITAGQIFRLTAYEPGPGCALSGELEQKISEFLSGNLEVSLRSALQKSRI